MPFFNLTSRGGGTGVIGGRSRGVKSFLLRQVITRGYLVGGYINSQPWTNVNYIQHSTDSAVDQGNLISSAGGYIGSSHNANRHFVWNTGGMGGYSTASSYNMRTNVNTGDFSMPQTYDDSEGMQSSDPVTGFGMMAYVFGNSTTISKFNLATEGFAGTIGSSALNDSNAGHHYGENYGYVWNMLPKLNLAWLLRQTITNKKDIVLKLVLVGPATRDRITEETRFVNGTMLRIVLFLTTANLLLTLGKKI
jgi:hypothetical protein